MSIKIAIYIALTVLIISPTKGFSLRLPEGLEENLKKLSMKNQPNTEKFEDTEEPENEEPAIQTQIDDSHQKPDKEESCYNFTTCSVTLLNVFVKTIFFNHSPF